MRWSQPWSRAHDLVRNGHRQGKHWCESQGARGESGVLKQEHQLWKPSSILRDCRQPAPCFHLVQRNHQAALMPGTAPASCGERGDRWCSRKHLELPLAPAPPTRLGLVVNHEHSESSQLAPARSHIHVPARTRGFLLIFLTQPRHTLSQGSKIQPPLQPQQMD